MTQISTPIEVTSAVVNLGRNIHTARMRRRKTQDELARACGVTRKTIYRMEHGEAGIAIETYFQALWTLGLLQTAASLAAPDLDEHGKALERARMPRNARVPTAELDNNF